MNAKIMTIMQGMGIAVVAGAAGAAGADPDTVKALGDASPLLTPALTAGATFVGTVMAMAKVLPRLGALEDSVKSLRADIAKLARRRNRK